MSVAGTDVRVEFALQKQKFLDDPFNPNQLTWYRYPAIQANIAPAQSFQPFQPEVGLGGLPIGKYKASAMFAGEMTLSPRLKGELPWLLLAALGKVTTTADTPVTGAYRHRFTFPTNVLDLPWCAVRRLLPGADGSTYGQYGYDGFITDLTLVASANGQITASMTMMMREPGSAHNPSWTSQNTTFAVETTIPLAQDGTLKLAGESFRTTSVSVSLRNQISGVQDEQTIGRLTAGDLTVLSRMAEVRFNVVYENGSILSRVFSGSPVGTTLAPDVFETLTGSSPAFEAVFNAQKNIVGTTPFSLALAANAVTWEITREPIAQANQLMNIEITGMVKVPVSGEYFWIDVFSDDTAFVKPAANVLTGITTPILYEDNWSAVTLDNAMVFTSGLTNLNGGRIRIEYLANGPADGVLAMTEGTIGTVDGTNDGTGGKPYWIALDADATPTAVQTALRTISFVSATHPVGWTTIRVTVEDGAGGVNRKDFHINTTA